MSGEGPGIGPTASVMPPRAALAELVASLAPGGRLLHVRRLRGGNDAAAHSLEFEAGGTKQRVVLRRPRVAKHGVGAETEREYRLLGMLFEAGVRVPRPLRIEVDGPQMGGPYIVTEFAGRPVVNPRHAQRWLGELADALVEIHAITPESFDLGFLNRYTEEGVRAEVAAPLRQSLAGDALAEETWNVLRSSIDQISWPSATLVHDDYWPGNTVWRRNRLSGVVDWTTAEVGDPRTDVAQCRLDLAAMHGMEYADGFSAAYSKSGMGNTTRDLWFFDLFRGLRALASYDRWLVGYRDIGIRWLDAEMMRARIETFLRGSLRDAEGAS